MRCERRLDGGLPERCQRNRRSGHPEAAQHQDPRGQRPRLPGQPRVAHGNPGAGAHDGRRQGARRGRRQGRRQAARPQRRGQAAGHIFLDLERLFK